MSKNTEFPYSFEVYCKEHPEKFETRINHTKRMTYGIGAAICILIACFGGIVARIPIISLFPKWMILLAAVGGALYCLVVFFLDSDNLHNLESNGIVKRIGHKKFDRVNTKYDEITEALARHDFDFLADAAATENDPLQLYVYEDAVGKEFYIHLRAYITPSEFSGASDVVTVSGVEYDQFKSTIRSIHPVK